MVRQLFPFILCRLSTGYPYQKKTEKSYWNRSPISTAFQIQPAIGGPLSSFPPPALGNLHSWMYPYMHYPFNPYWTLDFPVPATQGFFQKPSVTGSLPVQIPGLYQTPSVGGSVQFPNFPEFPTIGKEPNIVSNTGEEPVIIDAQLRPAILSSHEKPSRDVEPPCISDIDCADVPYTGCVEGTCQCQQGFIFQDKRCIKEEIEDLPQFETQKDTESMTPKQMEAESGLKTEKEEAIHSQRKHGVDQVLESQKKPESAAYQAEESQSAIDLAVHTEFQSQKYSDIIVASKEEGVEQEPEDQKDMNKEFSSYVHDPALINQGEKHTLEDQTTGTHVSIEEGVKRGPANHEDMDSDMHQTSETESSMEHGVEQQLQEQKGMDSGITSKEHGEEKEVEDQKNMDSGVDQTIETQSPMDHVAEKKLEDKEDMGSAIYSTTENQASMELGVTEEVKNKKNMDETVVTHAAMELGAEQNVEEQKDMDSGRHKTNGTQRPSKDEVGKELQSENDMDQTIKIQAFMEHGVKQELETYVNMDSGMYQTSETVTSMEYGVEQKPEESKGMDPEIYQTIENQAFMKDQKNTASGIDQTPKTQSAVEDGAHELGYQKNMDSGTYYQTMETQASEEQGVEKKAEDQKNMYSGVDQTIETQSPMSHALEKKLENNDMYPAIYQTTENQASNELEGEQEVNHQKDTDSSIDETIVTQATMKHGSEQKAEGQKDMDSGVYQMTDIQPSMEHGIEKELKVQKDMDSGRLTKNEASMQFKVEKEVNDKKDTEPAIGEITVMQAAMEHGAEQKTEGQKDTDSRIYTTETQPSMEHGAEKEIQVQKDMHPGMDQSIKTQTSMEDVVTQELGNQKDTDSGVETQTFAQHEEDQKGMDLAMNQTVEAQTPMELKNPAVQGVQNQKDINKGMDEAFQSGKNTELSIDKQMLVAEQQLQNFVDMVSNAVEQLKSEEPEEGKVGFDLEQEDKETLVHQSGIHSQVNVVSEPVQEFGSQSSMEYDTDEVLENQVDKETAVLQSNTEHGSDPQLKQTMYTESQDMQEVGSTVNMVSNDVPKFESPTKTEREAQGQLHKDSGGNQLLENQKTMTDQQFQGQYNLLSAIHEPEGQMIPEHGSYSELESETPMTQLFGHEDHTDTKLVEMQADTSGGVEVEYDAGHSQNQPPGNAEDAELVQLLVNDNVEVPNVLQIANEEEAIPESHGNINLEIKEQFDSQETVEHEIVQPFQGDEIVSQWELQNQWDLGSQSFQQLENELDAAFQELENYESIIFEQLQSMHMTALEENKLRQPCINDEACLEHFALGSICTAAGVCECPKGTTLNYYYECGTTEPDVSEEESGGFVSETDSFGSEMEMDENDASTVSLQNVTCPEGYTNAHNKCYMLMNKFRSSYHGAQMICALTVEGGRLATIQNEAELDVVTDYVRNVIHGCRTEGELDPMILLGGREIHNTNQFLWTNPGTSPSLTEFRNWASGEPNDGIKESAICMECADACENYYDPPWSKDKWRDCTGYHYFLCETNPLLEQK